MGNECYFLSIDLGSTGNKIALVNEKGEFACSRYFKTLIKHPKLGEVDQDPDNCLKVSMTGAREVIEESGIPAEKIAAVCFTGQMGGIIGIDSDFNLCTGYDSPLDTRCNKYIEYLTGNFHKELLSNTSGNPTHASKMLYWKNEHPDIYSRVFRFVPLSSYVCGKWCNHKGKNAFYDYTNLSFTGLNNVCGLDWNPELCRLFGLDAGKLPEIVKPWDIVGTVTAETSGISGLVQGTPVIAGAGDQPAGFLGAGMVVQNAAIEVSGGTSVFSITSDRFVPDIESGSVVYMNSVFPDLYYPLSYVNGGQNIRWFIENFAKEEERQAEVENRDILLLLEEKAAEIEAGSGDLLFVPHLSGQHCPNVPEFSGAWVGLTWGHTPIHMYRSVLEAVAYSHRCALVRMKQLFPGLKIKTVRATGGGSKSRLWNSIKADVLGVPVYTLNQPETGLKGVALLAAYGIGCISDLKKASLETSVKQNQIEPSKENEKIYRYMTESYKNCLNCLELHFNKTKLWRNL